MFAMFRSMLRVALPAVLAATVAGCGSNPDPALIDDMEPGTYAWFDTNHGQFVARLFTERVPATTANFIELAEGTRPFIENGRETTRPFYDGTIIHRIVRNFCIQGGDPLGTGAGGPGYTFEDEFHPELRHDRRGIVSMANSGPDTNGSQFFILMRPAPTLDDKHTVFGEVVRGMETIDRIEMVPTRRERPIREVRLRAVRILRK